MTRDWIRRRARVVSVGTGCASMVLAAVVVALTPSAGAAAELVVQAEAYAAQSGVQRRADRRHRRRPERRATCANGDWMRYDGVDLGAAGHADRRRAGRLRRRRPGTVELRTGSATGPLLAQFPITATGGWQAWITQTATVTTPPGRRPDGVRGPAQHRQRRRLRQHQLVLVQLRRRTARVTGWVDVDQAKWNAQLAAFTRDGHGAGAGQRRAGAGVQRDVHVQPLLQGRPDRLPGPAGRVAHAQLLRQPQHQREHHHRTRCCAQRRHELRAGRRTSPRTGSRPCTSAARRSSRRASSSTTARGCTDPSQTVPFPQGFRMIAGDAQAAGAHPGRLGQPVLLRRDPGGEIGRSADGNWPVCAPGATLMFQLVFPDCWDGVHLDSPDHKAHVAYTYDGTCAARSRWRSRRSRSSSRTRPAGSADGFTLASGMASSMHGDSFIAWDNDGAGPPGEELHRPEGQVQHRRAVLSR